MRYPSLYSFLLVSVFIAILPISIRAQAQKDSPKEFISLNQYKYQVIRETIERYQETNQDISSPDIQANMLITLAKIMQIAPKGKPDERSDEELKEEANVIALKSLTDSDEDIAIAKAGIAKAAGKEADTVLGIAEIKTNVFIKYKRGDSVYSVEGIFYGWKGNAIQIGDRSVAIIDLLPEYRVKFDKTFNDLKRKEFINNKVQDYSEAKSEAKREKMLQIFRKMKMELTKKNEENGFIPYGDKWYSVKDTIELVCKGLIAERKRIKEQAAEELRREVERSEAKARSEKEAADDYLFPFQSAWDGSIPQVEQYLKDNLKDPSSYEAIGWSKAKRYGDGYTVSHKFRAKNSFGGYEVEVWRFQLDGKRNVIGVSKLNLNALR